MRQCICGKLTCRFCFSQPQPVENSQLQKLMHFDLLIRETEIYSSSHHEVSYIGIIGNRIQAVGNLSNATAETYISGRGLAALPGVIDTQVHFREPGMEHKEDLESGTRAAVMGGVTTIFEMPNTSPNTTSEERLNDKLNRAAGRAWANYAFFIGAAMDNVHELGRLEVLPGTPGIKIFMGSSTGTLLVPDDETLLQVLSNGRYRVPVHAEDHFRLSDRKSLISSAPTVHEHPVLRDAECARLATDRLLRLCEATGRPVHVLHVSTLDELPLLRQAKYKGLPATAEITPQHLWFAAPECYDQLGTLAQMNPPLRTDEHRQALRQAVKDGLFDVIGSDHAPHTLEEKAQPYPASPSGMPGVQTSLPAMLTLGRKEGLLDVKKFVQMSAEAPAALYGIKNKGRIAQGMDADIVLVDLERKEIVRQEWLQSKCGWSPFEGEEMTGWPVHTIVAGVWSVQDCELAGTPAGRVVEFQRD